MASQASIASQVRVSLSKLQLNISVASSVRDLGVSNASGRRRAVGLLKFRFSKVGKRVRRITGFARRNRRAAKLFSYRCEACCRVWITDPRACAH